jgi:hypothetical protein
MGNNKAKRTFDDFMKIADLPDYMKKLRTIQKDFKLTDGQMDIVKRHLFHVFCKPTIQVYCFGYKIDNIKINKQKGNSIYLTTKDFIEKNRILLNSEIKD